MAKTVFLDLDDTLADFLGHPKIDDPAVNGVHAMYDEGFFLSLKPMPGALVHVRKIIDMGYDVHILTQPVRHSPHSYSEKVKWVAMWFPELLGKITMTQDKGLIVGNYLIDDNQKWKDGFQKNGGMFLHFDKTASEKSWEWMYNFLKDIRNKGEER